MTFTHRFEGTLGEIDYGRMRYQVIFLPPSVQKKPPFNEGGRLRMEGTVGGQPCALAFLRSGGRHYLLVSKALARKARVALGDRIEVRFSFVGDDVVHVPEELEEAFRQEPAWGTLWRALTPGKQRGLAHMVESAKRPETRAKRAVDVMRLVEEGRPPGPPPRSRRS